MTVRCEIAQSRATSAKGGTRVTCDPVPASRAFPVSLARLARASLRPSHRHPEHRRRDELQTGDDGEGVGIVQVRDQNPC